MGNKKPKKKAKEINYILAIASVVTATATLLKVIFDFIIQLISLGN